MKTDYFEVFGLPRKLAVDSAELQRRFYALAREHHPDFHQAAPAEERARIEATSALVNAAYRTLRDPIARVEYLVRLEGAQRGRQGSARRDDAGNSRGTAGEPACAAQGRRDAPGRAPQRPLGQRGARRTPRDPRRVQGGARHPRISAHGDR
ncbi:MAG: Fe-S protein assembly co-chaperone HscB [Candidatus Rokuibacteriota bacterium]|nr:MAG: Fe-S protein assembly co-chaperone HscB [Candidatus Rokubacteria bacterium]